MPLRITTPTRGERLLIQRRRQGLTQRQAAAAYGHTLFGYRKWENDQENETVNVRIGRLSDPEKCFLLRRRKGLTLPQLAAEVGCCRLWLNQMEKGTANPDRLIAYWQSA